MIDAPALQLPFEKLETDVAWDPERHLEVTPPEQVVLLEEWGRRLRARRRSPRSRSRSRFASSPTRAPRPSGRSATELEAYATGMERIPKKLRGPVYRPAFLRGMTFDPTILAFLSELAHVRLEPHPVHHHAVHINYAPDDLSLNVDQWHGDAVAFDYVLLASDPRGMQGGRFEYYAGPVEEGRDLLLAGEQLPPEKVRSPELPAAGWAVSSRDIACSTARASSRRATRASRW